MAQAGSEPRRHSAPGSLGDDKGALSRRSAEHVARVAANWPTLANGMRLAKGAQDACCFDLRSRDAQVMA
jgi:hypothetical protein